MTPNRMAWVVLLLAAIGITTVERRVEAQIVIIPSQPTTSDSVHIAVGLAFPGTCWWPASINCQQGTADTLIAVVDVQYCGCTCAQVPVSYQMTCNAGLLVPGSYVAEFLVNPLSVSDPLHYTPKYRSFMVSGVVPTSRRTWGALKQIYR